MADLTWSRKDQFCRDQYAVEQPEERPSIAVKAKMFELESKTAEPDSGFARFNFGEGLWDE